MSDDKNGATGRELTTTTTRSAVSGAMTALAGMPPEFIIATALAQFVPFVAGLVFGVAWNVKKDAAERWWRELLREVAHSEGVTDKEAEERIREKADEPHVREAIFRSLRALLESVDDSSTVPLARLVAEYHRERAIPDAFFRGVARLLAELNSAELAELRRITSFGLSGTDAAESIMLVALDRDISSGGSADTWPKVPWHVLLFTGGEKGLRSSRARLDGLVDPVRLLQLLETNGLVGRPDAPGWYGIDPMRVAITPSALKRLHDLIRE